MSQHVDAAAAWIYRGVWASIVALFRMPPHPPTLPVVAESVRALRPSLGYLHYLKFFFWVLLIPGDFIPIVAWVAIAIQYPDVGAALVVPVLLLVAAPDVVAYIAIHLRYDTTWYVLTDRSLRIRRGIWVIHETTISFENVQNVEVRQGPVQRYFGIADVVVQTAGGGGARQHHGEASTSGGAHVGLLQGLDDAGPVRDLILERVKRTRSAGLGDEHVGPPPSAGPVGAALSPMHLAALREISEVARRMATIRSDAPR